MRRPGTTPNGREEFTHTRHLFRAVSCFFPFPLPIPSFDFPFPSPPHPLPSYLVEPFAAFPTEWLVRVPERHRRLKHRSCSPPPPHVSWRWDSYVLVAKGDEGRDMC